eukprot:ctg_465.g172
MLDYATLTPVSAASAFRSSYSTDRRETLSTNDAAANCWAVAVAAVAAAAALRYCARCRATASGWPMPSASTDA